MHPFPRMKRYTTVAAVILGCLAPSSSAPSQEPELALVTSKGSGTVYTRPTHVVFHFRETVTGDTMEASIAASSELNEALRAFVAENDLRPSATETAAPAIVSVEGNLVQTTASLTFSMTPYAAGEAGAEKLGALCDQLFGFAKERGCEVSKPDLLTTETSSVTQDAVLQATKDAYTAASGAAAALGGSVREVDTVEIEAIQWNEPPDVESAYPTVDKIACTAKVRLTYLIGFP